MPSTINKKTRKTISKGRSAQAALDYLMSWGWVLIIIVLVLVILFSLGVFKVPAAPTIISGFKGITMQAAEANSTMMVVKITNNYNQFINVTGITVNVNGNTYTTFYCLDSIISTGQSTLCRVPVSIPTTSYISKVQISFTPYKSSIYEVSNGTVSSTLVSGAIPINNQLTYFIEKGLPYGSTFTVNYNTSTNSTIVSSIKDNVSFNLPFGNYYFSVPSVTYQGCISKPVPSSGYHSTGVRDIIAFTSNCTTTFTETGLPSNQNWQVTFNGTTKSNSTGSAINIKTDNINNAQVYYTATAKSDNLACVSYNNPSVRLGSSYTFSAWNCTTTFTETGLPSGKQWYITNYDGSSSPTVSTGGAISILQTNIPVVSYYTASSSGYPLNELNCTSSTTAQQGSSGNNFNPWSCTTTFTETALPSGGKWNASYNGSTDSFLSVGSNAVFKRNNVVTVESYSASAVSDNLDCSSALSSVQMGDTVQFTPWTCVTIFSSGLPSSYNSYDWRVTYTGAQSSYSSVTNSIPITTTGITTVSYEPVTQANVENTGCNYNATSVGYLEGSINIFSVNYWDCVTTFTESGLSSGTNWAVIIGSNEPTGSSTSLSASSIPGTKSVYIPGDLLTSSGQKYTQSNSPSSVLAGTSSNIDYSQQSPTSVPSGVIFYVPITISNSQSQSTPNGFQQRIEFNANNYGEFESNNMQNVLFFTSSGQIISSWLELGNSTYSSTTYWLSLPFSIGSYSTAVIYMGFGLPSTNFFSQYPGQVGEAPQLSSTYGEYDNGGNVFNLYLNGNSNTASGTDPTSDPFSVISYYDFNGFSTSSGSCPVTSASGISYPGSQTSNGDVSAIYNVGGCLYYPPNGDVVTTYTKPLPNQPVILESNFNIENALGSDNGVVGLTNYSYVPDQNATSQIDSTQDSSPPLWGMGTQSGGVNVNDCNTATCYLEYQDYAKDDYFSGSCSSDPSTGAVICLGSQDGTYSHGNNEQGTANGNWNYAELKYDGSSTYYSYVGGLPQYINSGSGYSSTENAGFSFSGNSLYFSTLSWTGTGGKYAYKTYFNWIFARDYPPGGSMPSTSFGGITPVGYADITGNNNQNYDFAVTWSGGNANIYWAAGSPGYITYDLTNTLTGTSISSESTTNWCISSAATNINLPVGIYSVSGGTGAGGGKCSSPNDAVVALES